MMFINLPKTKELVFRRPNPRLVVLPVPLFDQIEQVHCAKLLGIYFSDALQFETRLVNLLKICSQRTYLLKLLRDQGMPRTHLNTVYGHNTCEDHLCITSLERISYCRANWTDQFLS